MSHQRRACGSRYAKSRCWPRRRRSRAGSTAQTPPSSTVPPCSTPDLPGNFRSTQPSRPCRCDGRRVDRRIFVPGRVRVAADPEHAQVEQGHHGGEHPVAGRSPAGRIGSRPVPDLRQALGDLQNAVDLLLVPGRAPRGVVETVFAAGRVGAGLDVAARVRRDPHVLPGRGNRQTPHALDRAGAGDPGAVRAEVGETAPGPAPGQPRPGQIATPQPHHRPLPHRPGRTIAPGSTTPNSSRR